MTPEQKNVRTAILLFAIALMFLLGFIARLWLSR